MKNASKLACVLGCALLAGAFSVAIMNVTNGASSTDINLSNPLHTIKLEDLYLNGDESGFAKLSASDNQLKILNGLVIHDGDTNNTVGENAHLVVIGGGNSNKIQGDDISKAGIVGGSQNLVQSSSSAAAGMVIGGGSSNKAVSPYAVVAGGSENEAHRENVILGGYNNYTSDNPWSVILGGYNNSVDGGQSLVMGLNARSSAYSFVWNDGGGMDDVQPGSNSAYIGADNGLLIGTYTARDGIKLLVNGAIKLGSESVSNPVGGEIIEYKGCFYVSDGGKWHIMGKSSEKSGECENIGLGKTCKFGNIQLQYGDVVEAYIEPFSENCVKIPQIMCDEKWDDDAYYPYCYQMDGSSYKQGQGDRYFVRGYVPGPSDQQVFLEEEVGRRDYSIQTSAGGYDLIDFNKDGKVDISDNIWFSDNCYKAIMGGVSLSSEDKEKCDLTSDGLIDISDYMLFSDEFNEKALGGGNGYDRVDLDEDGDVDVVDYIWVEDKCINSGIMGQGLLTASEKTKCDLNEDGKVDVSDQIGFSNEFNEKGVDSNAIKYAKKFYQNFTDDGCGLSVSSTQNDRINFNKDGVVDVLDYLRLEEKCTNAGILGKGTLTSSEKSKCDLNEDGEVDVSDQIGFYNEFDKKLCG